jgi:hypothetical protein
MTREDHATHDVVPDTAVEDETVSVVRTNGHVVVIFNEECVVLSRSEFSLLLRMGENKRKNVFSAPDFIVARLKGGRVSIKKKDRAIILPPHAWDGLVRIGEANAH